MISLEQIVRDILSAALRDGVVGPSAEYSDSDPQLRTSADLAGVANVLRDRLNQINGTSNA